MAVKYKSIRKENPTPEDLMHDMREICRYFNVYIKNADIFSDYFAERITLLRKHSYYYASRLEVLAYRHERAKRFYAQNNKQLKAAS